MSWKVLGKTIVATCVVTAAMAGHASAGKYHVYSCRTPSGEVAPANGWSGSTVGSYAYAENTCSINGALRAALGDETEHGVETDRAIWGLTVPPLETLAGATLWRAGDTAGGGIVNATYQFWFEGPGEIITFEKSSTFDVCLWTLGCEARGNRTEPLATENRLEVPTANLGSHLYSDVSCGGMIGHKCPAGVGDENGYASVIYLYAADLLLEQNEGPSASEPGGPLATESSVHGTSDLTFKATDPASGVYEAVFSIDGKAVESMVINENSGHCKNVGETTDGLPAFLYVQPCPKSVSADVGFDTTKVSNGKHHLVVTVTDPAGNSAYVLDREIDVLNPPVNIAPPVASPATPDQAVPESTTTGTWMHEPTSYTYQWERCNAAGGECKEITGATSSKYTPVEADVEHTLVVKVTAKNEAGSSSVSSVVTGSVQPVGRITEYSLTEKANVLDITAGPDGNLWFTSVTSSGNIGKITPSGTVTEYALPAESSPIGIITGPDGNLWFTNEGLSKVGKITTSGTITEYALPSGSDPRLIAAGPDGNLWFAERNTSKIGKITTSGAITEYSLPSGSEPRGIAAGPDGNLWFTDKGTSRVGKITTTSGAITEYVLPTNSKPWIIVTGPDGNLWFTDEATSKVGKITTSGTITEYALPSGSYPNSITAGADGNLWFGDDGTGKIGRITTSGAITEYSLLSEGRPYTITAGPDDNLWFGNNSVGKIGKITP